MESLLKDISQYFEFLKEIGQERVNISDEIQTIVDEWWVSCEGDQNSEIYIVDSKATFFNGESGQLLLKILKAMNLTKEYVCITDILFPNALKNKITRNNPKIIIALGKEASNLILNNNSQIECLRGRLHKFYDIKVMPTWHPLSLLKNPEKKREVWSDMKIVMKFIGL